MRPCPEQASYMSILHDRIQAGRVCRHWRGIRLLPQMPLPCTIDSYDGQHLFAMPNSYGKTGIKSISDIIVRVWGLRICIVVH